MTSTILLICSIAVPLCAVLAYQAHLNQQTTLSWMRLHANTFGISSQAIEPGRPVEVHAPAEPRRVHKLSVPIPVGGVSREQVKAYAATVMNTK